MANWHNLIKAFGTLSFITLTSYLFVNCSNFKARTQHSDTSSTMFQFNGCADPNKPTANKIYALGASEYLNIAEDLFPGVSHESLETLTKALPVVPSAFDGNLELKAHSGFILERSSIVEYFAQKLTAIAASMCTNIDDCRSRILSSYLPKIYRREIQANEIEELINQNKDIDFETFAELIFFSPEFHFKSYSTQLTPQEFVTKISMTLFGTFPSPQLLAKKNEIFSDPQALRAELLNAFEQQKSARRFTERFWVKWLNVESLKNMELPDSVDFDKDAALNDLYHEIEGALVSEKSLGDLFYGPSVDGTIPKSLITHPSFAMASSRVIDGKLKSHYVHRGINITNKLLCIQLPPLLPATLEELENAKAETANLSFMAAIEKHRSNPNCSSCHSIIDPAGVTLEHLSPFGGYRENFIDGSPILSQGTFLSQEYRDFNSFIEIIAESGQLRGCFLSTLKDLTDGQENKELGSCDAKDIFIQSQDKPIIDVLTEMLSSSRFKQSTNGEE